MDRALPAKKIKTEKVIVKFEVERLKAPFLLRCGALLIDYILLIAVPVMTILLSRYMGNDGAKLLNSEINSTGWLIAILLGLTNFVILPMFSGQSLGKMLTGIRIVRLDGHEATLGNLSVRHLIGYPLTFLTFGLGFLISLLNQKGRSLHDYLAGTVVVYGKRRVANEKLK